jgi:MoaA/NifB/PqqE/SkfB family radical SAM enzyme
MKEQAMKSEFLQASRETNGIDLDVLASHSLNETFFRTEKLFEDLSLKEKVRRVMSYRPKIFQVETTTRCNLNCPLCSTHHLKRGYTETRLELIQRIVAGNPRIHYMCLHLMGEPLLSNSIFAIIEYLKSKNVYTYFSTNGMLLKEKVNEILSSGLDKISISLDGINQTDVARYRASADLERIVKGIKRLRKERDARDLNHPLIQIQTIMFPYNEAKEDDIIRFMKSLGVDRVKLKSPSFDSFGGRNDKNGNFFRTTKDAVRKYSRGIESYKKYRDRAVCRLLFQGFALADGSVVPCCIDYDGNHSFGNLNSQTWEEIRTSEKRRAILERFFSGELDVCKECSLGYDYSTTVFDKG